MTTSSKCKADETLHLKITTKYGDCAVKYGDCAAKASFSSSSEEWML